MMAAYSLNEGQTTDGGWDAPDVYNIAVGGAQPAHGLRISCVRGRSARGFCHLSVCLPVCLSVCTEAGAAGGAIFAKIALPALFVNIAHFTKMHPFALQHQNNDFPLKSALLEPFGNVPYLFQKATKLPSKNVGLQQHFQPWAAMERKYTFS